MKKLGKIDEWRRGVVPKNPVSVNMSGVDCWEQTAPPIFYEWLFVRR